jgi:cyclophilin family peptidyl-prolyl cis-trans isomerase
MVNQGPNTNASQFFFTLGSTPELDKKNTLFGKVVGNTLFNMLKLGEGEIIGENPVHKHKIIKAEVRYDKIHRVERFSMFRLYQIHLIIWSLDLVLKQKLLMKMKTRKELNQLYL